MASLNTDPTLISTVLNCLDCLDYDNYVIAFGPSGRYFFATPDGYAANYLPSKTLAELAIGAIKRVLWVSFGNGPESWFFAYESKHNKVAIRLGPNAPRSLFKYIDQISSTCNDLLGSLRVQLGNHGSFVVWSKSTWACQNVPEKLRSRLCTWSSGTRSHRGVLMGNLKEDSLATVTWHEDGSHFVRTQNNKVGWTFRANATRAAWDKLWAGPSSRGPGLAGVAGLCCVAINPHALESDTFAFIKTQGAGDEAPFVLHFSDEPVYARLSPSDGRVQKTAPQSDQPFRWAASTKSGRPHMRDGWELELTKGQRIRVVQDMGNNWYVAVGKKGVKGWVHSSWLDFSDGHSHEHPKAAWVRFSLDVTKMMKTPPIKEFLSMADYVDVCTSAECTYVKSDSSLGICAHDLEVLLQGSGRYSVEWLRKERNMWHPDRFARFCLPKLAEQLKLKAQQLFVLYGVLVDMEGAKA